MLLMFFSSRGTRRKPPGQGPNNGGLRHARDVVRTPVRSSGSPELTARMRTTNVSQVAPRPKARTGSEARMRVMFENSTVCHA